MRPFISAVLSFLMPGLGQSQNGQVIKGIIIYALYLSLFFILYFLNLFQTFSGFIAILTITFGLYLYIIIDAVYFSIRRNTKEIGFQKKWPLFVILIVIHLIISAYYKDYINNNFIKAHKEKNDSMSPTLAVGDYFIADYNFYKDNPVIPNEVVVFKFPKNPNQKFIKRCIATSGQEIEIRDKVIYIDGRLFSGFQISQFNANADPSSIDNQTDFGPVTVPQKHCFVLGDNRDNSYDSRYWGFVPMENVIARPLYVYWSKDFSRIGKLIN